MIAFDVKLDPSSEKFLLEQAQKIPREVRRAFLFACGIALRNMRLRMRGTSDKIEKWQEFTRNYRAKQATYWSPASKFGGRLMWPNAKQLTMQQEGDRVRIGWIGAFESAAIKFQDGGSAPTSPKWRHHLYKTGFPYGSVPKVADTPARPVVAQISEEASRHIDDWTIGALARVLKGSIPKWEMRYQQNAGTREGARAAKYASALAGAYEQVRIR